MAAIDIRKDVDNPDEIIFGECNEVDGDLAYYLMEDAAHAFSIHSYDGGVTVRKSDVKHLIKALQKAVELGWAK